MTRALVVLRPDPGGAATAGRIAGWGLTAIRRPAFALAAMPWRVPDPAGFDALLLTSANTVLLAGPELVELAGLPVIAVGDATARAAAAAGLTVAVVGASDAAAARAAARDAGYRRLLHLSGRERAGPGDADAAVCVYAAEPVAFRADDLAGTVALLHSPRAAAAFATAIDGAGVDRASIRLAALSPAILRAAGGGWGAVRAASHPDDAALVALAAALAIDPPAGDGDKAV